MIINLMKCYETGEKNLHLYGMTKMESYKEKF